MSSLHRAVWSALGAAVLFGASTPFAKQLLGDGTPTSSPFLLAGLLYLGSGLGLTAVRLVRDRGWKPVSLPSHEWPWAPFVGAALSVALFGEPTNLLFWVAAGLMAAGVWLHLHPQMQHRHAHFPDIHHRHSHS